MAATMPLPAHNSDVVSTRDTSKKVAKNASKTPATGGFVLGKYREIIIAVALFLLFDLSVLILNFYTSFQIAEDAVGINLAGRQRMLSQRTAKALISVEAANLKGLPQGMALDELQAAVTLFDVSLKGFQRGATVPGGNGTPLRLNAAEGPKAANILEKTQDLWTPYQASLSPVLAGTASQTQLQVAVEYAKANNLKLLGLMNELTTTLEAVAAQRANTLRTVQTVGIALALLNFAFILFKFLGRLRASDDAIEAVTEENREILTSVREGLFLLTPDKRLGSQMSKATHGLLGTFGKPLVPGQDFFEVLGQMLTEKVGADARDYVDLLFSPHVKEQLVQGINPLTQVQARFKNRLGHDVTRHLSFAFNRVMDTSGAVPTVRHLLVTVQDISQTVDLQERLNSERQRSQKEFSMLLKAFETDPAMMRSFVNRSETLLLEVNDLLRSASHTSSEAQVLKVVDGAYRRIHTFKGDAASLGLDVLATLAHQFETELQKLKETGTATGDTLLALPLPLEDLLSKVGSLKALSAQKQALPAPLEDSSAAVTDTLNAQLCRLASDVAADCAKQVSIVVQTSSLLDLPSAKANLVRDIAIQLVRNAVVHGLEMPGARLANSKPAQGQLTVSLSRDDADKWQLRVRDDGAGLNAEHIRRKLIDLGWYTPLQLESLSDKQVVTHIFKPGFSTASIASPHAGRGVGLDVVHHAVQALGARLLVSSMSSQHTEFRIFFTA